MLRGRFVVLLVWLAFLTPPAPAQSPRVLYTWEGTGNLQGWTQGFGDNTLVLDNATSGELVITETGTEGTGAAIADDANVITEGGPTIGGLDLTGLTALELDIGHDGEGAVDVQFYVQATTAFTFLALGPDQPIAPGVATYTAPLGGLLPLEVAYIRVIGVNIRAHEAEGNLAWTLREVRSAGEPLPFRDFATHDAGTFDGGLQGAAVNFDNSAVGGNDGGQNQTGLLHNLDALPPGNTGSLRWVDLASGNGAAVTWHNGTVWGGNSFNERPTDMSNYTSIFVRIAATNVDAGFVEMVGVQYFLQTGNFNFQQAGPIQPLPADGEFHILEFPIAAIPRLDFVAAHGVNLQGHPTGDLVIDVDNLRAVKAASFPDCNDNGFPDAGDLVDGRSQDCNRNGLPDECDIAEGRSEDCDVNGAPDECDIARPVGERTLYTWAGTGSAQDWMKIFGGNEVVIENVVDGELTVSEIGTEGLGVALSDGFNTIAEGSASVGGLDLTGADFLAFELGHDGGGPIQVQFFVQATPGFEFLALGPDQDVESGTAEYLAPLGGLSPAQIAYIRTIGINIRDHAGLGNLSYSLLRVRSVGTPLAQRDFARHDAGTSDMGLQGAIVAADNAGVEGNDGGMNQTGLSQNTGASPPGNGGSLHWVDLAGGPGGTVAWFNGTAWAGDTFNERPTDMSGYERVVFRLAATNIRGGEALSVPVVYTLFGPGFAPFPAGPAAVLPVDGQFHELEFSIAGVPDRAYVEAHTLDLGEHPLGDLAIDVDNVRALHVGPTPRDCNANRSPDSCDITGGGSVDSDRNGVPDECEGGRQVPGDCNQDARLDISDGVCLLGFLFLGTLPRLPCGSGAATDPGNVILFDWQRDGRVDLSDAVSILNFLFQGGRSHPLAIAGRETTGCVLMTGCPSSARCVE